MSNTYTNGATLPVSQLEQGGATEVLVYLKLTTFQIQYVPGT